MNLGRIEKLQLLKILIESQWNLNVVLKARCNPDFQGTADSGRVDEPQNKR